jgi:hypothetical protein
LVEHRTFLADMNIEHDLEFLDTGCWVRKVMEHKDFYEALLFLKILKKNLVEETRKNFIHLIRIIHTRFILNEIKNFLKLNQVISFQLTKFRHFLYTLYLNFSQ